MFDSLGATALSAGDVVSAHSKHYVVLSINDDKITLLPALESPSPAHRADVPFRHWTDAASALPVTAKHIVRCVPTERSVDAAELQRGGRLLPEMMDTIRGAVRREALIRKHVEVGPIASNLCASTASRGRRIGAVRYS